MFFVLTKKIEVEQKRVELENKISWAETVKPVELNQTSTMGEKSIATGILSRMDKLNSSAQHDESNWASAVVDQSTLRY